MEHRKVQALPRACAFVALGALTLGTGTFGQVVEDEVDFNPANPANWHYSWDSQGQDSFLTWYGGGSTSGVAIWPSWFNPSPTIYSIGPGIGYYEKQAQRILVADWIGLGPAPVTVLTRLGVSAEGSSTSGSVQVFSDFASEVQNLSGESGWPIHVRLSNETELNLSVGVELLVEQFVRAQCLGPNEYLPFLPSLGASHELLERSVGLELAQRTYRRDDQLGMRENVRQEWGAMRGDVVCRPQYDAYGGYIEARATVVLNASLFGPWESSRSIVWSEPYDWVSPQTSPTFRWYIGRPELLQIVSSAQPVVKHVSVSVTENTGLGVTRGNGYDLHLHAEREVVFVGEPFREYLDEYRASPEVVGPATIGAGLGVSVSASRAVTSSLELGGSVGIADIVELAVSQATGTEYGVSCQIASSFQAQFNVPAGHRGWIVHQPFFKRRLVLLACYGDQGYDGLQPAYSNSHESSPAVAPFQDFVEELETAPIGGPS